MKRQIAVQVLLLSVALLGGCGEPEDEPIDSLNPNTPSVAPSVTADSMEIEAPRE